MESKLFDAFNSGCVESLKNFLSQGANVNAKNSDGNTLLHEAVVKMNTEIVNLLIDFGVDVNLQNNKGDTVLKLVLQCEDETTMGILIKILVQAGADPNTFGDEGKTALHEAVIIGDCDLVKFLISQKADVTIKDKNGKWTALHYAADNLRSEDPSMFELLLLAGGDPNAKNFSERTPLHVLSGCMPEVESLSLIKIVEIFSKYGADFNVIDFQYCTPIDIAILGKNTAALEALSLHRKIDLNIRGSSKTHLHRACAGKHLPSVKVLLKNGANLNSVDEENVSPLLTAIKNVSPFGTKENSTVELELIKYLLKWDPDVNIITDHGENILTASTFSMPDFLWKLILQHLAKLRAMHGPIQVSILETISNDLRYNNYFKKCIQELEVAKYCQICPHNSVTFLNIIVDDKKKLFLYTGNRDFINYFHEYHKKINQIFPIYGETIREKFSKAMEKRNIWYQAAEKLSSFFPKNVNPEHIIIRKILGLLKNKDLLNFSQTNKGIN